jgi:3-methyladenine DNA glycosylase AlkD
MNSARFFKTGKGQYGEGDHFIGITVPQLRKVARAYKQLPLDEIVKLLHSAVHEYRLTALIIMVGQYKRGTQAEQAKIYKTYLANTKWINNWDLVDSSAGYIVGPQLGTNYAATLAKLAKSADLWERRIAMLACFYTIQQGDPEPAFYVIEFLKHDEHDLIQKAVGWMLREIGKRCGRDVLHDWLLRDNQYQQLPRTTLRYAIEHYPQAERKAFLQGVAQ